MGEKTTREQREKLALAGFVRVDGLKAFLPSTLDDGRVIRANTDSFGRVGYRTGQFVFVTTGGEAWWAAGISESMEGRLATRRSDMIVALMTELCPHGSTEFLPCPDGEEILGSDILRRLADPDWQPAD